MSWDKNVRDNPEKFGLAEIGEVEWSEPDYTFDTTIVWRDAAGQFYYASDAGCSCPRPFEDFESLDDLTQGTFHEVAEFLNERLGDEHYEPGDREYAAPQVVDLLARMRLA